MEMSRPAQKTWHKFQIPEKKLIEFGHLKDMAHPYLWAHKKNSNKFSSASNKLSTMNNNSVNSAYKLPNSDSQLALTLGLDHLFGGGNGSL